MVRLADAAPSTASERDNLDTKIDTMFNAGEATVNASPNDSPGKATARPRLEGALSMFRPEVLYEQRWHKDMLISGGRDARPTIATFGLQLVA